MERKIQRPSIPRARGEMVRNDGPEHEFDAFFRREYRRMVASVMRAGATVEDAEDAVSSAMALAAKRFKSLDNPTAWVRTVALRTHRRSANRDWERRDREESAPRTRSSQPDDYDFMRSVRTALKQLPRAQAVVLALAIDGYTTQEIASMLNANEDTVRSNLRHARAKIAAAIRGGDQNG